MKKYIALAVIAALALIIYANVAKVNKQEDVLVIDDTLLENGEPQTQESGEGSEEDGQKIYTVSGPITEVAEGYIVIEDEVQGEVRVNLGEESMFEGVSGASELTVDQVITAEHDGKMTLSIPPQVFGLHVVVEQKE